MSEESARRLSWRAPSWRNGAGIALAVLGQSSLVVFVLMGLLLEHTPRTESVPVNGAIGSALCVALGLALWASVPRIRVDLVRRVVCRGSERIADLTQTRAVLQREVRQEFVGTAGGKMRVTSWSLLLIQEQTDAAELATRLADHGRDPVATVTILDGASRAKVAGVGKRLAECLGVPCFELDAAYRLTAVS